MSERRLAMLYQSIYINKMINEDDYYFEDYKEYNDKKWTADNIKTLVQWNCIAAYNIEVLDMSISMYQR